MCSSLTSVWVHYASNPFQRFFTNDYLHISLGLHICHAAIFYSHCSARALEQLRLFYRHGWHVLS